MVAVKQLQINTPKCFSINNLYCSFVQSFLQQLFVLIEATQDPVYTRFQWNIYVSAIWSTSNVSHTGGKKRREEGERSSNTKTFQVLERWFSCVEVVSYTEKTKRKTYSSLRNSRHRLINVYALFFFFNYYNSHNMDPFKKSRLVLALFFLGRLLCRVKLDSSLLTFKTVFDKNGSTQGPF